MKFEIKQGSVLDADVDAVVTAANPYLIYGGGLCGETFRQAGEKELEQELSKFDGCEVGDAVITSGCKLKAKYIIHAVGPKYYVDDNPQKDLKNAYLKSLQLADEKGLKSIAFPCLSVGINGFPLEEATQIAIDVISSYKSINLTKCFIFCYTALEFKSYFFIKNKKI